MRRLGKIVLIIIILTMILTTYNHNLVIANNKIDELDTTMQSKLKASNDNETTIGKEIFKESVEEFNNPDMGIYRPTAIQCQAVDDWSDTKIQYANGLVHLRIGLKSFTKAGNGIKDYDITEEHIEKLNQYMRSSKRSGRNGYCKICI